MRPHRPDAVGRVLAALGALYAASAIALGAYAAHGLASDSAARLQTPLLYLLVHGALLAALAPRLRNRIECGAAIVLAAGVLLFCGSVIAGVLAGWSTRPAPVGGMLMIAAWVCYAIGALRRT